MKLIDADALKALIDESRIRWEWHGEWHEADLEQLIMAYETENYWNKWDCITMKQEDFDVLIELVRRGANNESN